MVIEPRPRRVTVASPSLLEAATAVSAKVISAAQAASAQLFELGIPHALIGGIAVAAHGAPRATKDVDFLVKQSDAFSGNVILSFRAGVPIAVRDVVVDYLTPEGTPYEAVLLTEMYAAKASPDVPIIGLDPLVLMKLIAGRRRDLDDVARLLDKAHTEQRVRSYIADVAPDLLERLDLALNP